MELLSVWNGIPFLRSSLGLIPTSFEIGSSAFQNDFRTSIQKNWLTKILPAFFVFGVEKPKLANPCACLAVTFSLTYFWPSQIEPVWCLLSRYGGPTTFFSHLLKIQKIITPRGGICASCQSRRECKIFASGVNFYIFTHFLCFFLLKLSKLGEIDSVNFLA